MDHYTPATFEQAIGRTFSSGWFVVDQRRIGVFGATTEDPDPHHMDPVYAAEHSPYGSTISYGFLTLSMLTPMLYQVMRFDMRGRSGEGYPASYGLKEVRFVAPVPVDSRIRGHFTPRSVRERKPGQLLMTTACSVEIEGRDRPALTALWESLWMTPGGAA